MQQNGLKLAKIIPIKIPKSGKKGKQRNRRRNGRNEMLKKEKLPKAGENNKSQWDDTK